MALSILKMFKKKPKKTNLWHKGIASGKTSFIGPKIAQVDITNNCNLNCIGCWCHSDLMGDMKLSQKIKGEHLSLEKFRELVNEFTQMGVQEIQFAGSGDPSTHPDFLEFVNLVKTKGMRLNLITNFTLLSKEDIDILVDLKVDHITISLWAGSEKAYVATHPNQTEKTFRRLKENISYLCSIRKKDHLPIVKIYNVISNKNSFDLINMVDFALETKADFVEFQVVDIVEGKSDMLSLSRKEKEHLVEQFSALRKKGTYFTELNNPVVLKPLKGAHKTEFSDFGRFFKGLLPKGFKMDLRYRRIFCPHGFGSRHCYVDEKKNTLYFSFPKNYCNKCNPKGFIVKEEFLNLLGFGSFYRRISSASLESAKYDINIVDTLPCYVGWTYTRILVNGDVIPCCKAVKKPLGNIYKESFKNIWTSEIYDEFRYNAKALKKSDPYFKEIECYKSCDNVGMNIDTHKELRKK